MTIAVEWTNGMSESEKQEFQKLLLSQRRITIRLKEILEARETVLLDKETSERLFEDPNWAYRQAHINGQRKVYKDLLNLLKFLDKQGK